ncbi:unnamed protein product [Cochlearia groenlandica]
MGRAPCCDKAGLKKGPWIHEEDQKLLAYIEEHGHGSWRSLPEKAGLQRCGKSCRLRWTNYLRPDIKRGKFTGQEEQTIIQLHALLGNRWSAIATHLPKRTDNEIKNYWNTHLKKRLVKMGIDPVTHKHKNETHTGQSKKAATISHMAQWESARLEAEARLARESKLLHYQNSNLTKTASTNWTKPNQGEIRERLISVFSLIWLLVTIFCTGKNLDEQLESPVTANMNMIELGVSSSNSSEHDWMRQINSPPQEENEEGFTRLLLMGDSTVAVEEVTREKESYYEDNKNYWNHILNLVDSTPSDSPLFFSS